ncbi:DUF1822 family protein [Coleofasciculus sp. FACHB-1120]|uniref:DUF1822 family protein n=1 Tax=Coleofasciculus sp. FACHB-1120 TaxID=2692783 RepID=UPI00168768A7|nr:DUF1822 family protein [Coleofasciculus sp. FACHB-1120]MBD2744958.1 DUF1822 family protein [Coleofasciculus sp. FACHB-1120]
MTFNTDELEDLALPLPITQAARTIAQQFATQQPTPHKAEQVLLNTLSVCVVNDYLQMMGIPTNLAASDSWNPIVRLCSDVADLEVRGIGRLECRPLRSTEQICHIPPEVWSDRIGYVMVQIDESMREASVLGFTPSVATSELSIGQLRSPEDLLDRLQELMHPITAPASSPTPSFSRTQANLSQWFNNIFEAGWQTVETLLTPESNLAFSFRGELVAPELKQPEAAVRKAKLIDLGIESADIFVALVVEINPESEGKTNILLQVHPMGSQTYLPPSLQLIVLDESGSNFLEAESREADDYIQLEFSGSPGEQFSIRVTLGNASIQEDFVI